MINLTNRSAVAYAESLGYSIVTVDGITTSSDDIAVQEIIDSYDPLPPAQAEAIAAIKAKANELILARVPIWKQNNLQAESLSIVAKPSRGKGSLSQADLTRLDEIEAINAYPLAVRAQSDIDEEAILAQTDWKLCIADFSGMEAI